MIEPLGGTSVHVRNTAFGSLVEITLRRRADYATPAAPRKGSRAAIRGDPMSISQPDLTACQRVAFRRNLSASEPRGSARYWRAYPGAERGRRFELRY